MISHFFVPSRPGELERWFSSFSLFFCLAQVSQSDDFSLFYYYF